MPNEKDISEKMLESYNEVFADILNALVFDGQEIVRPEELEDAVPASALKLEDGLHEQERDTIKRWRRGNIILAAVGLENQTASDPAMPLRVAAYDGGTYRDQINRYHSARRKRDTPEPFYPSVTIVLYFGTTHWSGPRTLRECFRDVPEELSALVPDYPIHVIEVAFLTPEQLGRLKSDFRHVAGYLVQARTREKYIPADGNIDHVDATLKLMGAITGDDRFQKKMNELVRPGKEKVTMYNIIDSYIEEGIEKGRKEGIAETRREYETVLAEKDRAMREKDRAMNAMAQELRELKLRYGLA